MKSVNLKALKEDLSLWTEKAAGGEIVEVTKYNRPFVWIVPSGTQNLRRGQKVGKASISPVLKEASQGKWLEVLLTDRNEK
jgi:antitoxin (DNA-binding transcriptional repressor) of toxin-antitoxin stability system